MEIITDVGETQNLRCEMNVLHELLFFSVPRRYPLRHCAQPAANHARA
jgi:hypothetical protein